MTGRITAITIAFVSLMTSAAWAADIFTPSLEAGNAAEVRCAVLNTGNRSAADVTITILDSDKNVRATQTVFIPPGEIQVVTDDTPSNTEYCRVSGIAKSHARVTLCLVDANSMCTTAVTAP